MLTKDLYEVLGRITEIGGVYSLFVHADLSEGLLHQLHPG